MPVFHLGIIFGMRVNKFNGGRLSEGKAINSTYFMNQFLVHRKEIFRQLIIMRQATLVFHQKPTKSDDSQRASMINAKTN